MYQRLGPNATVIDAMAGVGGNTIQFASMFPLVFGMELDPQRVSIGQTSNNNS
jgi:tRNA/tmRNA/rRNA uracil-C5-methylase (TrmA/RlmC/RlmD family)